MADCPSIHSPQDLHDRSHRLGVLIMVFSALLYSTMGLFTKGVSADGWSVIFWRGLFATLSIAGYLLLKGRFAREVIGMGRSGLWVTLIGAGGAAAFIFALKLTTIANVVLIYAAAPFIAATIAWFWFRERLAPEILIAALASFLGVGLIVGGSMGGLNLEGDVLALCMVVLMATVIVIYRHYPETPTAGPAALSSVLLLGPAFYFGDPLGVAFHEFLILAGFGLLFAVAIITFFEGAKRLPPGEAALISALETPLAILWAMLFFAEIPGPLTFFGGTIIIAAIVMAQMIPLWRRGKAGS